MIPSHVDKIQHLRSKAARFVLVVEKDATYQHLLESAKSMPYIMITVKPMFGNVSGALRCLKKCCCNDLFV